MSTGFTKRAMSVMLAMIMVFSAMTVMTFTANATDTLDVYYDADSFVSPDSLDASFYPEAVLTAYAEALANVRTVLADPEASQQEIDLAMAAYETAKADVFVDYSALEAAVALAPNIERDKDKFVYGYYRNYVEQIEEINTYYLGEDALYWTQAEVDSMTELLVSLYNHMYNDYTVEKMAAPLLPYIEFYYNTAYPTHLKDPYTIESWVLYSSVIKGAMVMLDSGIYCDADVADYVKAIEEQYQALKKESSMSYRPDLITSAGFQVKSAYAGKTVRIAVTTPMAGNALSVMVLDENGFPVDATVTIAPQNRRKPNDKVFYVDIVMPEESGQYVFTVHAITYTINASGAFLMFGGDPVDCAITVK